MLAAIALLLLIVSGPVAQSIGNVIGLGDTALTVWSIAKWPVLAADRRRGRRAALLRDAQRAAAEVPLDLGRRRRGHPGLGAGLGRLRVLRRRTSPATTRPTGHWRASSSRCCSCGSPTWRCCSAASSTPSSNADGSCRRASRPRRSSSSRPATPATSRRLARSGTRTSRSVAGSAARRRRPARTTTSRQDSQKEKS